MPWVNYKKKPTGPVTWEYASESVKIVDLDAYEQAKREAKWRVKGFYYVGIPGEVLVRSERSSEYAPKVKKPKAPKKAAKPKPAEVEPELSLT